MRSAILLATLALGVTAWRSQDPNPLFKRWVGTVPATAALLHFDFYGDTMLLLNDAKPLSFSLAGDSLTAWGSDTTFTIRYWFSMDRLLVLTAESSLVTMSQQDRMARPIWGFWRGSPIGRNDERIELHLYRGGVARYRQLPGGAWQNGEWDRNTRMLSFRWEADSTEWEGQYDPAGATLLFDSTYTESGTVFLRKVYR